MVWLSLVPMYSDIQLKFDAYFKWIIMQTTYIFFDNTVRLVYDSR